MTLIFARRMPDWWIEMCADTRITSNDWQYSDWFGKMTVKWNAYFCRAWNPCIWEAILNLQTCVSDETFPFALSKYIREVVSEPSYTLIVVHSDSIMSMNEECVVEHYKDCCIWWSWEQMWRYMIENWFDAKEIYEYVSSKIHDVWPYFKKIDIYDETS
jgi:hypothetical protein